MHVTRVDMVFFEILLMVMHLGKLRKNGQISKMNLVMLGLLLMFMLDYLLGYNQVLVDELRDYLKTPFTTL